MNVRQLLGLLGSLILIVAVFAPLVSIPIAGSINYFQNGKGDGIIILLLAIISIYLVISEKYKGLWFTGILSYIVMLITFFNFHYNVSEAKHNIRIEFGNNPFSDFADMMIQSVQLEWGWALLITGAALLLYSAASNNIEKYIIKTKNRSQNTVSPFSADFVTLRGKEYAAAPIKLIKNVEIIVGRSRRANIHLDNKYVSGHHLSLCLNQKKEVMVKDLGSSNGTYIAGKKLLPNMPAILKKGERLIIGSEDVVYMYS